MPLHNHHPRMLMALQTTLPSFSVILVRVVLLNLLLLLPFYFKVMLSHGSKGGITPTSRSRPSAKRDKTTQPTHIEIIEALRLCFRMALSIISWHSVRVINSSCSCIMGDPVPVQLISFPMLLHLPYLCMGLCRYHHHDCYKLNQKGLIRFLFFLFQTSSVLH